MKTTQGNAKVTGKEKLSYGLYFMGQNIFFGIVGMMTTYFTDIGIAAATVAVVALITKVWDAINDPIFGMLMDKIKFKRGKFIPWLRISLVAIPLATIFMFVIPSGLPMMVKAVWATIGYMLWDTAYTICDVPIFGLVTTMKRSKRASVPQFHRPPVCHFCGNCGRGGDPYVPPGSRRLGPHGDYPVHHRHSSHDPHLFFR